MDHKVISGIIIASDLEANLILYYERLTYPTGALTGRSVQAQHQTKRYLWRAASAGKDGVTKLAKKLNMPIKDIIVAR